MVYLYICCNFQAIRILIDKLLAINIFLRSYCVNKIIFVHKTQTIAV
jgi:hypothetical protein